MVLRDLLLALSATSSCTYCAVALGVVAPSLVVLALLWPVICPATEPLQVPSASDGEQPVRKQGSVILAGSYNPPHKGHVAMLTHLSRRYDKVFAVVGFNPSKAYAVTAEQRCTVLETMVSHLENVEPVAVRGYIWRFAYAQNVVGVYRGIRTWEQDGRSEQLLELQNRLGPAFLGLRWPYATTFLCLPDAAHAQIGAATDTFTSSGSALNVSSTDVRSRLANHAGIEDLVGNEAASVQIRKFWGPSLHGDGAAETAVQKTTRSTKLE